MPRILLTFVSTYLNALPAAWLLFVLQYNNHVLQIFTSCLFLAAAFAALLGMVLCKKFGRRFTMIMGGLAFIIGTCLLHRQPALNAPCTSCFICAGRKLGAQWKMIPYACTDNACNLLSTPRGREWPWETWPELCQSSDLDVWL